MQTGTTPLPDNLLRTTYLGINDISQIQFGGHTAHNALQTSLQRQFSRGNQFGLSYTWSTVPGTTSFDPLVPDNEIRNYGPQGTGRRP